MQFSYRGFQQKLGVREYTFSGLVNKQPDRVFHLTADLSLLAQHRVSIQEGPSLCTHLLTDALEQGEHLLDRYTQYEVSAPDLVAFTAPRRALAATRANRPPTRLHRPKPSQNSYPGGPQLAMTADNGGTR